MNEQWRYIYLIYYFWGLRCGLEIIGFVVSSRDFYIWFRRFGRGWEEWFIRRWPFLWKIGSEILRGLLCWLWGCILWRGAGCVFGDTRLRVCQLWMLWSENLSIMMFLQCSPSSKISYNNRIFYYVDVHTL